MAHHQRTHADPSYHSHCDAYILGCGLAYGRHFFKFNEFLVQSELVNNHIQQWNKTKMAHR